MEIHNELSTAYECSTCQKEFTSDKYRKNHEKTHKHELLKCPKCESVLKGKPSLQLHLKRMHTTDPNKIQCDRCMKCFTEREYLKIHMENIHSVIS